MIGPSGRLMLGRSCGVLKRGALEVLSRSCFGILEDFGTSGLAVVTEGIKVKIERR